MSNRFVNFLTLFILIALLGMAALNVFRLFYHPPAENYLSHNDVRGVAVEYKNLLYTLNFEQQNHLIDRINHSLQIPKETAGINKKLPFTRLIIYRFEKPDLIITPIGYREDNLVYYVPEWHSQGYLEDMSSGKLKNLIENSYDP